MHAIKKDQTHRYLPSILSRGTVWYSRAIAVWSNLLGDSNSNISNITTILLINVVVVTVWVMVTVIVIVLEIVKVIAIVILIVILIVISTW